MTKRGVRKRNVKNRRPDKARVVPPDGVAAAPGAGVPAVPAQGGSAAVAVDNAEAVDSRAHRSSPVERMELLDPEQAVAGGLAGGEASLRTAEKVAKSESRHPAGRV